ncbi:MAG: CopG family transcriptional regulator [Acidobacteriia bacterium]|nr:CopG family transcriptional regulator [Terriglobia bacterium]
MLKNITITVSEEAAHWARKKAAEENTSVSKLVGRMLEDQMRLTDDYWRAYEKWKKIKPIKGFDASKRLKREELYGRR